MSTIGPLRGVGHDPRNGFYGEEVGPPDKLAQMIADGEQDDRDATRKAQLRYLLTGEKINPLNFAGLPTTIFGDIPADVRAEAQRIRDDEAARRTKAEADRKKAMDKIRKELPMRASRLVTDFRKRFDAATEAVAHDLAREQLEAEHGIGLAVGTPHITIEAVAAAMRRLP